MVGNIKNPRSVMDDRKQELRLALEGIKVLLSRCGYEFKVINFPTNHRERSIDLVAVKDNNRLLIRIKVGTKGISKDEIIDLIKAASAIDALPIVLNNEATYEDVVSEKDGVYVMCSKTLSNILRGANDVFIFERKGELLVRISSRRLESYRLARGLSLGDLALLSGVSRRMIFEYLRNDSNVTLSVAEKLIEVFDEDIVEPINIETLRALFNKASPDTIDPEVNELLGISNTNDLYIYRINKSAPDYILRRVDHQPSVGFVINGRDMARTPFKFIVRKILETDKLTNIVSSDITILLRNDAKKPLVDALSTYNLNTNRVSIIECR